MFRIIRDRLEEPKSQGDSLFRFSSRDKQESYEPKPPEKESVFSRFSRANQERHQGGEPVAKPTERESLFSRFASRVPLERTEIEPNPKSHEKESVFRRFSRVSLDRHQDEAKSLEPAPRAPEPAHRITRIPYEPTLVPPEVPKPQPQPIQSSTSTLIEEAPAGPQILLPCPVCFRTFNVQSLDRHKNVCQKVATKKRKVFDSFKQRIQDLPGVDLSPTHQQPRSPSRMVPASPSLLRKPQQSLLKSPSNWKEKHLNLIKTVREARGADINRCPFCERNFGNKAFDRHVDWCREQQSRIPKSPTNVVEKERWEARTKYRAPPLRRSMRSLTRDKYSPTRSTFSTGGMSNGASPAASVDRLTLPDHFATAQSLSGSRASLDSRGSSTYSYQPPPTYTSNSAYRTAGGSHLNSVNNNRNHFASSTVGRSTGNAFLRQANERRSLRSAPSSPPPAPIVHREPPLAVNLDPINNNRTSALRASLRLKNFQPPQTSAFGSTISSGSGFLNKPRPATSPQPVKMQQPPSPVTPPAPPQVQQQTKRPTVLQLFTSAFSRPSPVAPAKNRSHIPTSAAAAANTYKPMQSSQQQQTASSQGRRSEPEGVESKLMTGSCFNYPPQSAAPAPPVRLNKPARSAPTQMGFKRRVVAGSPSTILPNKVRPMTTSTNQKSRAKRYGSDGYNPYLSAERQMAELFDDRPRVVKAAAVSPTAPSPAVAPPPAPSSVPEKADEASMEQLEEDLKSILSEISQLGKDRETAWKLPASKPSVPAKPASLQQPQVQSAVTKTEPFPVVPPQQQPTAKELPKFCHSCGAGYPDKFTVKFCCQCGARRLYV